MHYMLIYNVSTEVINLTVNSNKLQVSESEQLTNVH